MTGRVIMWKTLLKGENESISEIVSEADTKMEKDVLGADIILFNSYRGITFFLFQSANIMHSQILINNSQILYKYLFNY